MKAIYPGTFDPITNGHLNLIERACPLFSTFIVGVTTNAAKKPYFSLSTRLQCLRDSLNHLPQVEIYPFEGLLAHFAQEVQANFIVRGLRSVTDFEYEWQLAGINRKLYKPLETVFFTPSDETLFISSSFVREIAEFQGDITPFVPAPVYQAFKNKLK